MRSSDAGIREANFVPTAGTEYLSLTLSDNIEWSDHMNEIVKRLTVVCCLVKKLQHIVDREVELKVYYGYFHIVISDLIVFWGSSSEANSIFPQQLQIIRCMSEEHFMPPCRPIFKNVNILTITSVLILKSATVITRNNFNTNLFQMSPYFISRENYNTITGISQFYKDVHRFKEALKKLVLETRATKDFKDLRGPLRIMDFKSTWMKEERG